MKICIVGAGNIGLVLASVLSLDKTNEVTIYTRGTIDTSLFRFYDSESGEEHKNLGFRTEDNLEEAISGADYIFVTYPAFLRGKFIKEAENYISKGTNICFVPGYGGAEYMCKNLVERGVTVVGFQRVPFVARQENKEKATLLSRKTELKIAAIPKAKTEKVCKEIENLLKIKATPLNEYLAVTLAPSNPLLHLTGLYNVFHDHGVDEPFDKQLMFYEEWNVETSELLFKYDEELQEICRRMRPIDLSEVVSLKEYYESPTPEQMTKKLKSIEAFKVVKVPLIEQEDGSFLPDYNSRMFIEDFPYGIAIIKYFAVLTGVKTEAIDEILRFYEEKTGIKYFDEDGKPGKDFKETGIPSNYGLNTIEDIINFYN